MRHRDKLRHRPQRELVGGVGLVEGALLQGADSFLTRRFRVAVDAFVTLCGQRKAEDGGRQAVYVGTYSVKK